MFHLWFRIFHDGSLSQSVKRVSFQKNKRFHFHDILYEVRLKQHSGVKLLFISVFKGIQSALVHILKKLKSYAEQEEPGVNHQVYITICQEGITSGN
jgi:hypothetical protein